MEKSDEGVRGGRLSGHLGSLLLLFFVFDRTIPSALEEYENAGPVLLWDPLSCQRLIRQMEIIA